MLVLEATDDNLGTSTFCLSSELPVQEPLSLPTCPSLLLVSAFRKLQHKCHKEISRILKNTYVSCSSRYNFPYVKRRLFVVAIFFYSWKAKNGSVSSFYMAFYLTLSCYFNSSINLLIHSFHHCTSCCSSVLSRRAFGL